MNHAQHKFLTTIVVFVFMLIGIFMGSQFKDKSLGAINISLLLVNALLLLIILGILLQVKEAFTPKRQKRK